MYLYQSGTLEMYKTMDSRLLIERYSAPWAMLQLKDDSLVCVGQVPSVDRDDYDTEIEIYDIETGTVQQYIRQGSSTDRNTPAQILQLDDGRVVTHVNNIVSIWKLEDDSFYELVTTFVLYPKELSVNYICETSIAATSGDEIITATCLDRISSNYFVRVWNSNTGECKSYASLPELPTCLLMLSTGRLAIGSFDGVLRMA